MDRLETMNVLLFKRFCAVSAREKHYGSCSRNSQIKVKIPDEGSIYAILRCQKDFEVENTIQIKTPKTEKVNTHVQYVSEYMARLLMEMYLIHRRCSVVKICTEKFVEHLQDDLNRLCKTLSQQLITEYTNVFKREHEAAEISSFKSLMILRIES